MSSLIDSIRAFILTCPFLQDWRVNVDYIGEEMDIPLIPFRAIRSFRSIRTAGQRNSFSSRLPVRKNMIRMLGSILKTVAFFRDFLNGWKNRILW